MNSPSRDALRKTFDAGTPVVAFLVAFTAAGTAAGAAAAAVTGLLIAGYRLLRGHPVRLVAVSLGVVLVHALFAQQSGEGRDFFLPDLLMNALFTGVFGLSLLVRHPVTGAIARWSGLEERRWYQDRVRMRLHLRLTALWLSLWCLHLLVWLPLYAADAVVALGAASLVLGKPAVVVFAVLSWRLVRRSRQPASESSPVEEKPVEEKPVEENPPVEEKESSS